ncbi:mediator of RNA polymerase II transcription subunit 30-like [Watersipora subatra]|uniref:mediator of RNA polymerase II transcription subunit 30-like n=1 Tax=Watersipora subatra TaxID=2589382 RepID=UPI00355B61F5
MQQPGSKPRMPSGFPGAFSHQSSSLMFSPPGYSGPGGSLPSQSSADSGTGEHKQVAEANMARHCRIGQELVHEIVHKSTEVFQILKATQLFNHLHTNSVAYNERKKQLHDNLKIILDYFKQLKHIYATVRDSSSKLNMRPVTELIPFVEEGGGRKAEAEEQSEVYKQVAAEHLSLSQQLRSKNMELKEIIDILRNLQWEINTMMSVKSANS